MAAKTVKLVVSERKILGSAESRRLRKQGLIPGVIYGRVKPIAISITERDFRTALTTSAGSHAVLDVAIDGASSHSAILKEYQRDKVRGNITHVDLQEVRLDVLIQAVVSITLVGESVGVKEGGVLTQVTNQVNVEAFPLEVPQHLDVDVSELGVGDSFRLSQLQVPEGVTLLDDPEETVLASVHLGRDESETEGEAGEAPEAGGDTDTDEGEADGAEDGADGESASEE